MQNVTLTPSFAEEIMFEAQGYRLIAGIDEVGCGALAGPLVAAAVILPSGLNAPWLSRVRDSKQLSASMRQVLFQSIREVAVSVGIGTIPHHVIDARGLSKARRLAMKMAMEKLSPSPDCLLIDHLRLPEVSLTQKGITNGDQLCFSIACASIMAKVTRDQMMVKLDRTYPGYGLARHKGYGTREHLVCLRCLGPCPIHRRSYQPVKDVIGREK